MQKNGLTNSTLSKWSCCPRWFHQLAQWVRRRLSHNKALLLVKMLQQLSTGVWVLLESKKSPALELFQFSCSVMSDSLRPHGLQHARLPCLSPTPGACSSSCPSSWWCHPTILPSDIPFSSCLQYFPASESFPVSQFWSYLLKTIHIYWALRFVRHWASKVMLKILQARLQQYVNRELPDVQAGFRKGRGTRDQIANIHWITEKAREFQKNIYFCFIDYDKAFDCVDHNKLWKILKEMGIPDHLTCLLRNLYGGQEATVRTGHGTTDGFQIGKGVHQGCILSPCLFNLYA